VVLGMCCLVRTVWRIFTTPAYHYSRQFHTLSDICLCSMLHMFACHSAKNLSKVYGRTMHNVRSLLHSRSLSTVSSSELACFLQRDSSSGSLPFIAHRPVMLKMSRSLASSVCYLKVKTIGCENHSCLSFHRLRHYMPRQVTPSTKTIVDASPLSLQPYLRLIRFDRPIGMTHCYVYLLLV